MEKVLRSLIHETFPFDLRVEIELMSRRRDISNEEKQQEIIMLLQRYGIENVVQLGPGTNRYAFKVNGFVVKVATDHDGKIDNLKEFKMAKRLFPYVAKTYEVSYPSGTLLVAEYIPPFESYTEMCRYSNEIKKILTELSSVYLIGDVGIAPKNYSNWGLRIGTNDPVCLDFAYVYEVSSKLFVCKHCKSNMLLVPDENFNHLVCPNPSCGHRYKFEDIRAKIGNDIHRHEIGDLADEGYTLSESHVLTTLTDTRSNYLVRQKKEKKKSKSKNIQEETLSKEEPKMYTPDFKSPFANQPFSPSPIVIKGRSRPSKAGDIYLPEAVSSIPDDYVEEVQQPVDDGIAFTADMDNEPVVIHGRSFIEEEPVEVPEEEPVQEDAIPSMSMDPESVAQEFNNLLEADKEAVEVVEEVIEEAIEVEEPEPGPQIPTSIPQDFLDVVGDVISRFSNKAETYMRSINLYNKIRYHLICKKKLINENEFYKPAQNATYRSLASMMNFIEVMKEKDGKQRKTFIVNEDPNGKDYLPTMIFLYLCWKENLIDTCSDAREITMKCRQIYGEGLGIQEKWKSIYVKRLINKLSIDEEGAQIVCDTLAKVFCVEDPVIPQPAPVDNKTEEVPEEPNAVPEENDLSRCTSVLAYKHDELMGADNFNLDDMMRIVVYEVSIAGHEITLYADLVRLTLVVEYDDGAINHTDYQSLDEMSARLPRNIDNYMNTIRKLVSKIESENSTPNPEMSGDDPLAGSFNMEDPSSNEDDHDPDPYFTDVDCPIVSVSIIMDERFDITHIKTTDMIEDVCIPIYEKISDIRVPETIHSMIDDRNGEWDWLIHFIPAITFTTKDPDKWMAKYNDIIDDTTPKVVILDTSDDVYTMGMYMVDEFEIEDSEGNTDDTGLSSDEDFLMKFNVMVQNNIGITSTSFLKWMSEIELVTEEQVEEFIKLALDDDDDEDEDSDDGSDSGLADEGIAAAQAVLFGSMDELEPSILPERNNIPETSSEVRTMVSEDAKKKEHEFIPEPILADEDEEQERERDPERDEEELEKEPEMVTVAPAREPERTPSNMIFKPIRNRNIERDRGPSLER